MFIRPDGPDTDPSVEDDQWIGDLFDKQNKGDAAITFCIAIMITLGYVSWLYYTVRAGN